MIDVVSLVNVESLQSTQHTYVNVICCVTESESEKKAAATNSSWHKCVGEG